MSDKYLLRLYVTGEVSRFMDTVQELKVLLEGRVGSSYLLETFDVLGNPEKAFADGILATPTLLKVEPEPKIKVLGDLSNLESVLDKLDLTQGSSN